MRILFDRNTPAPLRYRLLGYHVETAWERGSAELKNGLLLQAAEEAGFDLMIATDKGIRHRQNLAGRRLALPVLSTNDWTQIRNFTATVATAISEIAPGSFVEIEVPFR